MFRIMRQTKEIRNFFYSQYFADGLRITMGCIVPLLICASLGQFHMGTVMSFGALLIGLSDTPGAPKHRRIGMISCLALCSCSAIITILVNQSVVLMTIVLAVLSFLFSMLAVFNARASTVGLMAILMMLINVDDFFTVEQTFYYLLYFLMGASWYMIISMSLTQVRPYRLAQQELSESIRHVADFIRLKANFYGKNVNLTDNYNKLIEKQVLVHSHQENVRDLLFQSKRSIKDTTKTGRYLSLVFADIIDLFEQSMTTHYDYEKIRATFYDYNILNDYKYFLLKITSELDHIAFKINANKVPVPLYSFDGNIEDIKIKIDKIESEYGVNTMPLKKILANLRAIVSLINNLYSYSHVNPRHVEKKEIEDASKFINASHIDWTSFRENLSLKSSVFRHALRMALVMSLSYFSMHLFNFGNFGTYWVLLTIMVILKPGFGLTKERNLQRLMGTAIGGIIGAIILMTIHDDLARFVLLVFFFLTAYSLFRVNYIAAVIFMTPYVLILLSFSGMNSIEIAKERIIDTFLGGSIAFLSSYVIFPNWESFQIKNNMSKLLIANYNYISHALKILYGYKSNITDIKLLRKDVYIASANMGSTFQRMLTEPKWKQTMTKEVNNFVILNHILSSYSATLLTMVSAKDMETFIEDHIKLLKSTLRNLEKSIQLIPLSEELDFKKFDMESVSEIDINENDETKIITEQLQFLNKISYDILKSTKDVLDKDKIIEKEIIQHEESI